MEASVIDTICGLSSLPLSAFDQDDTENISSEHKQSSKFKTVKPKRIYTKPKRIHELISFRTKAPRHFVRIPNTDHRYSYPKKICEYLSVGCTDKFREYMRFICVPDVSLILEYDGVQNPFGPNNRELNGIENVINFFIFLLHSAPDVVCTIYDDVIAHRNPDNEESFMTFKFLVSVTTLKIVVANTVEMNKSHPLTSEEKKEMKDTSLGESSYSKRETVLNFDAPILQSLKPDSNDTITTTTSNSGSIPGAPPQDVVSTDLTTDSSALTAESIPLPYAEEANGTSTTSTAIASKTTKRRKSVSSSVESVTEKMTTFSLAPVQTPIHSTYQVGKYYFTLNSDHKVVSMCDIFKVVDKKPIFPDVGV